MHIDNEGIRYSAICLTFVLYTRFQDDFMIDTELLFEDITHQQYSMRQHQTNAS